MSLVDPNAHVCPGCNAFTWRELTGWNLADAVQVARGRDLTCSILCPARRARGRIIVTNWIAWSWGALRDPAGHGNGGFADLVPLDCSVWELYVWIRDNLEYGEVIFEGDHVHVSLPGFGGHGEALLELEDGRYVVDPDRAAVSRAGLNAGTALLAVGIAAGVARKLWEGRR